MSLTASLTLLPLLCSWWSAPFADADYRRYPLDSFFDLPAIHQQISLSQPDYALLNAAVFYVTNRERARRRLPLLQFAPGLRNIAAHHAEAMATHDFVSHFNPYEPRYNTLAQRGTAYQTPVHAENVASTFIHAYTANTYYHTDRVASGYEFKDMQGRRLPVYTYLQFAERLVGSWMNSPGHRSNILHRELKKLGCAVRFPAGVAMSRSMPHAFAVQNFSY